MLLGLGVVNMKVWKYENRSCGSDHHLEGKKRSCLPTTRKATAAHSVNIRPMCHLSCIYILFLGFKYCTDLVVTLQSFMTEELDFSPRSLHSLCWEVCSFSQSRWYIPTSIYTSSGEAIFIILMQRYVGCVYQAFCICKVAISGWNYNLV